MDSMAHTTTLPVLYWSYQGYFQPPSGTNASAFLASIFNDIIFNKMFTVSTCVIWSEQITRLPIQHSFTKSLSLSIKLHLIRQLGNANLLDLTVWWLGIFYCLTCTTLHYNTALRFLTKGIIFLYSKYSSIRLTYYHVQSFHNHLKKHQIRYRQLEINSSTACWSTDSLKYLKTYCEAICKIGDSGAQRSCHRRPIHIRSTSSHISRCSSWLRRAKEHRKGGPANWCSIHRDTQLQEKKPTPSQ